MHSQPPTEPGSGNAAIRYPGVVSSNNRFRAYLAEDQPVGPWVEYPETAERALQHAVAFDNPGQLVNQIWENRASTWPSNGSRHLSQITSVWQVIAGWSATVNTWVSPQENHTQGRRGVVFLNTLRQSYLRAIDVELEIALEEVREPANPRDGDCIATARAVTQALIDKGRDARNVTVWAWATALGQRTLLYAHVVTFDSGYVVDFTARQFVGADKLPPRWIAPESAYRRRLAKATSAQLITVTPEN